MTQPIKYPIELDKDDPYLDVGLLESLKPSARERYIKFRKEGLDPMRSLKMLLSNIHKK
jgi:hypothetical protein